QAVRGITNAVTITSDSRPLQGSFCAVLSTGAVDCWGYNYFGELCNGTTQGTDGIGGFDTPQSTGINDAVSVASDGIDGYCAALSTGGIDCWGLNNSGQLGNGTTGGPDGPGGNTGGSEGQGSYDSPQAVSGITE